MKNLFFTLLKPFYFFVNLFDGLYLNQGIKQPIHVGHSKWLDYLVELGNKEGMRILEVGSREVTGISYARTKFDKAEYTGFDYYPGSNVDVVGDVHQLSSYFNPYHTHESSLSSKSSVDQPVPVIVGSICYSFRNLAICFFVFSFVLLFLLTEPSSLNNLQTWSIILPLGITSPQVLQVCNSLRKSIAFSFSVRLSLNMFG